MQKPIKIFGDREVIAMASSEIYQQLKEVLEKCNSPTELDDHPWVESLLVYQHLNEHPDLMKQPAGFQLLACLSELFRATMPNTAPRRGKRLDSSWGQFGILGALYFAPFDFGAVRPARLFDAWGRIDDVILRYRFGEQPEDLPENICQQYRLVGDETEVAPKSTLSDWHVRGLERLAEVLVAKEQKLSFELGKPSVVIEGPQAIENSKSRKRIPGRWIWVSVLLIGLLFVGWKGLRLYDLSRAIMKDIDQLQGLVTNDISFESIDQVGPILKKTRQDVQLLRKQVSPFRWAGQLLGWVPVYGGDAEQAGDLLDMASALLVAGDELFQVGGCQ